MIEIKDLLNRFQNILNKEGINRGVIIETIYRITKVKLDKEVVKIKDKIVYLNIKPLFKNEIFLKKEKILEELKSLLGNKSPVDFR